MKLAAWLFFLTWLTLVVGMLLWPRCGAKDDFAPFAGAAMGMSILGIWWSLGEIWSARRVRAAS